MWGTLQATRQQVAAARLVAISVLALVERSFELSKQPCKQAKDGKHPTDHSADACEEMKQRPPPLFNGEHHRRKVVGKDGGRHHLLIHLCRVRQRLLPPMGQPRSTHTFDEVKYSVTLY